MTRRCYRSRVEMGVAHHQFESIHSFFNGNCRTGRIVNVLYLVNKGLLDIPVLTLSSQIMRSKPTTACRRLRVSRPTQRRRGKRGSCTCWRRVRQRRN